ncbi:hypothetical protein ACFL0O_04380 [Thermodesulfobacteriota bacterium]
MPARKNQARGDTTDGHSPSESVSKSVSTDGNASAEKKNFLDITALIRSVQRAEDQDDCFQRGMLDCDQLDCKWRSFCLEGHQAPGKDNI